jgi:hypothetical protein
MVGFKDGPELAMKDAGTTKRAMSMVCLRS